MTLEEIFNDPENYPDNVRIKRMSRINSFPIHWIKKLIEWNKEDKLIYVQDHLEAQDWEIVDDN